MRRVAFFLQMAMLIILVALASIWTALAFYYRLPMPEAGRILAAVAVGLFGFGVVLSLFTRHRWTGVGLLAAAFACVLVWWGSLTPPRDVAYAPQVARQVTGVIEGNQLTLTGVRNFAWRTPTEGTESWETRTYDLSKLKSLDLFMSYWAGPEMAHTIMSFGFSDGQQLAWSIEVRYRVGGAYSPVAGAFKTDTLVMLAADERDVVGLRTNIRGEDVRLYRLNATREEARAVLTGYVEQANELAAEPQFYNSITTNCTTSIVHILRLVGATVPTDWRLLANGYLPGFLYEQGRVDTRVPLPELIERSRINDKARAFGLEPGFSAAIREGVPDPMD